MPFVFFEFQGGDICQRGARFCQGAAASLKWSPAFGENGSGWGHLVIDLEMCHWVQVLMNLILNYHLQGGHNTVHLFLFVTVKPPKKDTPQKEHVPTSRQRTSWKHSCIHTIQNQLWKRTTSLQRTKQLVQQVPFIKRFHCNYQRVPYYKLWKVPWDFMEEMYHVTNTIKIILFRKNDDFQYWEN